MWWFSEQSLLNLISRYTPRRYRTCKFVIQPKWTPLLPEACRLCSQLGFKTRRNDRIWFILSQLLKVYHSLATHSYTCLSHILSAFWCLDGDINSVPDEESVLWCISFRKECNRHPVPRGNVHFLGLGFSRESVCDMDSQNSNSKSNGVFMVGGECYVMDGIWCRKRRHSACPGSVKNTPHCRSVSIWERETKQRQHNKKTIPQRPEIAWAESGLKK